MAHSFHRDDATFARVDVNDISNGMLRLTADTTFYVDPLAGGSNANDGIILPWATIQYGVDYIGTSVDPAGYQVVLQVADNGSHYPGVNLCEVIHIKRGGWPVKPLVIRGNVATPASGPLISDGTQAGVLGIGVTTPWLIEGFKIQSSVADVEADWGSHIYVGKNKFPFASPSKIVSIYGSLVEIIDDIEIAAAGDAVFNTAYQGQILMVGSKTLTVTGTPAFAGAFAIATTNSVIAVPGVTISGAATGQRYFAATGGGIETGGGGANFFPGNVAGAATAPGWYE